MSASKKEAGVIMTTSFELEAVEQSWPMDKVFRTSRGERTAAHVVLVTLTDGQHTGRGESVPSARYGESIASVLAQLQSLDLTNCADFNRRELQDLIPAGSARNALDCALWDLEAKSSNKESVGTSRRSRCG